MSFSDISARMRKQQDAVAADAPVYDIEESYRVRARMVGVLLRDARQHARRSLEECARLLRVEPSQMEAWEYGDAAPSLPQLELLANYLDVPVSQFWSGTTLLDEADERASAKSEYLALRDRMIGALLRQSREDAGMTPEALAEVSGITAAQVEAYELGDAPLPMHVLTVLASGVKKNVSYFLETGGTVGELLALREAYRQFAQMPPELRAFVTNPLNAGFIEIARMFSQMPTDKLRKVGEAFLDITM
jgi:transcriptional regulator with XRE-family HTH domain